ncbi:uncharacterized protein LOC108911717 [Anoplophora glabripennis]|uniref:uncharacterized protein LOC108911717 n=1 Tax=Anoplophora glabripennis TaxID=217634 RepID=UPI0008755564|nr:uncharacterized protein LOC108911717 [Anoplophora glabripennis]
MSSCASAFFGWGSAEERTPAPQYFYHKRLLPSSGPVYTIGGNERQQVPSVPIQVPLQAQFAPLPGVHNVQLVPCLCPVSQDYPYDQTQTENIYVSAVPVQQIPSQQQLQQQPSKA